MVWAKMQQDKIIGTCQNCPPMSEAGVIEAGWEERSDDDPAVQTYYQEQANPAGSNQANMLNFRLDMLTNPGYLRVTLAAASFGGVLLVTRLETALSFEAPHWPTVQALWGQLLASLSMLSKPTASEVAAWNTIAQNRHITAIEFAASGAIVLTP